MSERDVLLVCPDSVGLSKLLCRLMLNIYIVTNCVVLPSYSIGVKAFASKQRQTCRPKQRRVEG